MPTVSSITRQSDMVAQLSHKLFRLDMAAANDSILVGAPIKIGADFLKSEFGGQPGLTTMVENYKTDKSNFGADLKDAISTLQKSADNLKNSVQSEPAEEVSAEEVATSSTSNSNANSNANLATLGEFAKNNVPPHEKSNFGQADLRAQNNSAARQQQEQAQRISQRDYMKEFAENYLVAEKNQNVSEQEDVQTDQDERLNAVQNFVRDYNNAAQYLNENSLNKNEELKNSLSEIGISVNSSGELSVDTKTLADALQNDSENVGKVLGSDGLAGQIDRETQRLNRQGENLFPSIVDYAGQKNSDRAESLYSAKNMMTAAYANFNAGNLLNRFT